MHFYQDTIVSLIPFFSISYFLFFLKNNRLNTILTSLLLLSTFAFASNYSSIGLFFNSQLFESLSNIPIFRYLHRFLGILAAISAILYVLRFRVNILKDPVSIILAFSRATEAPYLHYINAL